MREQLKALTCGRSVHVVCDAVGGAFSETALRSMAWRGRHLVIGFANGEIPKIPLNLVLLKGFPLVGVFCGDYVRREPQHGAADLLALVELCRSCAVRPLVSGRFTLEQTSDALLAPMQRKASNKLRWSSCHE